MKTNKEQSFSPKQEIINHFDSLIHRIDINIEENLEKYNEEEILSNLEFIQKKYRNVRSDFRYKLDFHFASCKPWQNNDYQTAELWPESMKIVDYLIT